MVIIATRIIGCMMAQAIPRTACLYLAFTSRNVKLITSSLYSDSFRKSDITRDPAVIVVGTVFIVRIAKHDTGQHCRTIRRVLRTLMVRRQKVCKRQAEADSLS